LNVSIVSPEKKVWEGEADMVVARSPEGEFAILRGHIPFLAALVSGVVKVKSGSSEDRFVITGGVLEASGTMNDYHVILLADDALDAGDLTRDEALRRMKEKERQERAEHERVEAELRAAMAGPQLGRD
jgi:F-type H+-transporting ATPase subunit epsilon